MTLFVVEVITALLCFLLIFAKYADLTSVLEQDCDVYGVFGSDYSAQMLFKVSFASSSASSSVMKMSNAADTTPQRPFKCHRRAFNNRI